MELKLRRRQRRGQVADSVAPASHKGLTIVAIARHGIVKNTQARRPVGPGTVNQNSFSAEKRKWKSKRSKMANGKGQRLRDKGNLFECASDSAQFIAAILKIAKRSKRPPLFSGGLGGVWVAPSLKFSQGLNCCCWFGSLLLLAACKCFV